MKHPKNRSLMIHLILSKLDDSNTPLHTLNVQNDKAELENLITTVEKQIPFKKMLGEVNFFLMADQISSQKKLKRLANQKTSLAAISPQLTAAIRKTYSAKAIAKFMSIQNAHLSAGILVNHTHPAFYQPIRTDHAKMVRARARHDYPEAAYCAARLVHHIMYSQQLHIENHTKSYWMKQYNQHIANFVQRTDYENFADTFATRLAALPLLQFVFHERSLERYAHDSIYTAWNSYNDEALSTLSNLIRQYHVNTTPQQQYE